MTDYTPILPFTQIYTLGPISIRPCSTGYGYYARGTLSEINWFVESYGETPELAVNALETYVTSGMFEKARTS